MKKHMLLNERRTACKVDRINSPWKLSVIFFCSPRISTRTHFSLRSTVIDLDRGRISRFLALTRVLLELSSRAHSNQSKAEEASSDLLVIEDAISTVGCRDGDESSITLRFC